MESLRCEICAKSFTGLVCYKQHEASEKHKKKVQQMSGSAFELPSPVKPSQINPDAINQLQCPVCMVSISGFDNYQKHVVSLEHAIMVQKKSNDLLSTSVSDTFELKTERNQPLQPPISFTSPTKAIDAYAECKPCQKQFSGPEPYQQHLASAGHRKKLCLSNQIMQNDQTDSTVGNMKITNILPDDPLSPTSACNLSETASQYFAKCDTCQLLFNGALPYQMHLESEGHKKKVDNQSLGNSFNQGAYKCEICIMAFSGPVPYQQHLVSHGHKKKMMAADLTKELEAAGSLSPLNSTLEGKSVSPQQSGMNDFPRWYCNTCKIQCSGPIPYNTHIIGQMHEKNVRIQAIDEKMRKARESIPHPFVGNETDSNLSNEVTSSTADLHSGSKIEMEKSTAEFKVNDLNINLKMDDTKILSDKFQINANDLLALPNLNIVPPEKLNVTVFRPDDEIVFSSPKKCMLELISEKRVEEMFNS